MPHFEPETWGIYDYTVLESINRLMRKVKGYGIKLIIALHDRYALGCYSCDAYQKEPGDVLGCRFKLSFAFSIC